MQGKALPGFRDFYPEDLSLRNHIFATWRNVARRYGFEEYDGPPLESLELYTQKSGDEIVQQLYAFRDKGDREVALRPEMTPTLARMVAGRGQALKKPIRWYSIPQLFRYERQQKGRLREHFQLNMDIIGEASPLADAELIAASIDIMRELGFGPKDVKVRVSDREAVVKALKRHAQIETNEELLGALAAIDRHERDPKGALAILEKTLKDKNRVNRAVEFVESLAEPAPSLKNLVRRYWEVDDEGKSHVDEKLRLDQCIEYLQAMGLAEFVATDFRIVRGLAYYTGIVFEMFDAGSSLRAICGGGRYDGLLAAMGGPDLPALGFGMGDVVLGELLKERGVAPKDPGQVGAFLIAVGGDDLPWVLKLAHAMRERGIAVEYGLRHTGVRKQLELAAARGAPRAVIIGPDERQAGQAVVRDLKAGTEAKVPFDKLLNGYFD